MSTLVRDGKEESAILYVKGASEVVLELCHYELINDQEISLTSNRKAEILEQIQNWAKNGLRTLTLAHKRVNLSEVDHAKCEDGELDHTLTLLAIVGIKDPVREEVPQAVRDCQRAGITVRMLTGDNILTASV